MERTPFREEGQLAAERGEGGNQIPAGALHCVVRQPEALSGENPTRGGGDPDPVPDPLNRARIQCLPEAGTEEVQPVQPRRPEPLLHRRALVENRHHAQAGQSRRRDRHQHHQEGESTAKAE